MATVFISHSTKDKQFAESIAASMRSKGIKVWISLDSILPGEEWVDAIDRGLRGATHFILIESPNAVDSYWVGLEMQSAIRLSHEKNLVIIPIKYRPCDESRPILWGNYQGIPFNNNLPSLINHVLIAIGWQEDAIANPISQAVSYEARNELFDLASERFLSTVSGNTRRQYEARIKSFLTWYAAQPFAPLPNILQRYVTYLRDEKELRTVTVRTIFRTVRMMLHSAAELDHSLASEVLQLSRVQLPIIREPVKNIILSAAQVKDLLSLPGLDSIKGKRDTCMLTLLVKVGLLRSEVAKLTWGNINRAEHSAITQTSRGTIEIPQELADLVYDWGRSAVLDVNNPNQRVFCQITRDGRVKRKDEGLTGHAIYKMLDEYTKIGGLPRVTPRDLQLTARELAGG